MAKTNTIGLSRLVLARRERAVMLQPRDKGIVLWTLRYGDELRDPAEVFSGIKAKKPEAKLLSLVETLIADLTKPWDPAMVGDPVQDRLKDIIAARRSKTRKPAKKASAEEPEPETPSNVVSIMDALKKSIAREKKTKKR